jgi:hypothetical protein
MNKMLRYLGFIVLVFPVYADECRYAPPGESEYCSGKEICTLAKDGIHSICHRSDCHVIGSYVCTRADRTTYRWDPNNSLLAMPSTTFVYAGGVSPSRVGKELRMDEEGNVYAHCVKEQTK